MNKPPYRFRPQGAPDVPVLGLPYEVRAVIPTVIAICKCEANTIIVLLGIGGQGQCPACKRGFMLQAVSADLQGQAAAAIAHGLPTQADS